MVILFPVPGISESLANTLKQKELLMERIKQYKEISKRPMTKPSVQTVRRESTIDTKTEVKKVCILGNTSISFSMEILDFYTNFCSFSLFQKEKKRKKYITCIK